MNCKEATTPINVNDKLGFQDGTERANTRYFKSLIGCLIYLSYAKPDITFSIGVISKFIHSPTRHNLGVAKKVMHNIVGTIDYGI